MAIKNLIATFLEDPAFVDKLFEDEEEKDVPDTKLALLAVGDGLDNALNDLEPATMLSGPVFASMIEGWEEEMPLMTEKEVALLIEFEVREVLGGRARGGGVVVVVVGGSWQRQHRP